jgi:hypothetical protein
LPALAIAVIAIALPDSLNPSLIVAEVYLTLGRHPVARALLFTVTAFAVTLAGGRLATGSQPAGPSWRRRLRHVLAWA